MNHYPISFDDLPDWARNETRSILGQNKRPNAYITALDAPTVGGSFHDGQRLTLIARNDRGELSRVVGSFGGVNPFVSNRENLVNTGTRMHIPSGCAVLEISEGIVESVELFLSPQDSVKFLPVSNPLSDVQCALLDMLASLTSAGRRDAITRYRIPQWFYDAVCAELRDLGMVKIDARGAVSVTLKGKQTRNSWDSNKYQSYWYQWGDSWQYGADYRYHPTGQTAQILQGYKAKRGQ